MTAKQESHIQIHNPPCSYNIPAAHSVHINSDRTDLQQIKRDSRHTPSAVAHCTHDFMCGYKSHS
jgi:hypothetical protein